MNTSFLLLLVRGFLTLSWRFWQRFCNFFRRVIEFCAEVLWLLSGFILPFGGFPEKDLLKYKFANGINDEKCYIYHWVLTSSSIYFIGWEVFLSSTKISIRNNFWKVTPKNTILAKMKRSIYINIIKQARYVKTVFDLQCISAVLELVDIFVSQQFHCPFQWFDHWFVAGLEY